MAFYSISLSVETIPREKKVDGSKRFVRFLWNIRMKCYYVKSCKKLQKSIRLGGRLFIMEMANFANQSKDKRVSLNSTSSLKTF